MTGGMPCRCAAFGATSSLSWTSCPLLWPLMVTVSRALTPRCSCLYAGKKAKIRLWPFKSSHCHHFASESQSKAAAYNN